MSAPRATWFGGAIVVAPPPTGHGPDRRAEGQRRERSRSQFVSLAGILDDYNEGVIAPGHGDEIAIIGRRGAGRVHRSGRHQVEVASQALCVPELAPQSGDLPIWCVPHLDAHGRQLVAERV